MGEKARKRFAELHDAYEKARSAREYSTVLARTGAVDDAAASFSSEEGLAKIEAQLEALADERKALKKLVKYARKNTGKIARPKATAPAPTPINGAGKRAKATPPAA